MSEKVKKEDVKKVELKEDCLKKVSGGNGEVFSNNIVGKDDREKINTSGPEDHWFED